MRDADLADAAAPRNPAALFVAFTLLALQGFGGVLAVAQRVLCEQRRWLSREQFVELLSFAQVLPGPNVCNLALMVGDRFFGWRGAVAALSGMLALPLLIVLALSALYVNFGHTPLAAGALKGMGAVAAGLVIGTALKLAPALRQSPLGRMVCIAAAGATFIAVALMRWPLLWVLLALGPAACLWAAHRIRRDRAAGDAAAGR